jgi:outer membrane protein TolC
LVFISEKKEIIFSPAFKPKHGNMRVFFWLALFLPACVFAQNSLEDFIRQAKQSSPLLQDNKNQSQANRLEVERLRAFYNKPQLGITATYQLAPIVSFDNNKTRLEANTEGNVNNYYGYDIAASNGGIYQVLVNVNKPVLNGERAKVFSGLAAMSSQINDNNIRLIEHDLEKFVTDQYILCLQDQTQLLVSQEVTQILDEQKTIVLRLVQSGILKQSDLTLLNIEYQTQQSLILTYQAIYRRDLADLRLLAGNTDTTLIRLPEIVLALRENTEASNYLNRFRLDSLNLNAAQQIFELKYKPFFNVFANAGLNAVYAPTIPQRFGFSGGINLTWNLLDGNQKKITRSRTGFLLNSVKAYRDNFILQNNLRKNRVLAELNSLESRAAVQRQQLRDYQSLLDAYKKEVIQGQLSVINYITVLKNVTTVRRDVLLLEANRLLLINNYNYWNW